MSNKIKKFLNILEKDDKTRLVKLLAVALALNFIEILGFTIIIPAISFVVSEISIIKFKEFLNLEILNSFSNDEIKFYSLLFMFLIYFVKSILQIIFYKYQNKTYFIIMKNISTKLYRSYLYKPYSYFLKKNTSVIISNISVIAPDVVYNFLIPLFTLFTELALISLIVILLLIIDLKAFLVFLFISILSFLIFKILGGKLKELGNIRVSSEKARTLCVQHTFVGIKENIILDRLEYFYNKFSNIFDDFKNILTKYFTYLELPKIFLELSGLLGLIVFIYILIKNGITGSEIVAPLAMISIVAYRVLPSANRIIVSLQKIKFAFPSVESIYTDLNSEQNYIEIEDSNKALSVDLKDSIEIKNVTFEYDEGNKIFDNINLKINKNETIGIYGPSGSGKSTIVNLIIGLLKPFSGKILVDGKDITKNLKSWHKKVGYVPQSINLIDDSIKENITLGEEYISYKVSDVLKKSQLDIFADNQSLKIGENASRISGGQKQRLGIARAFYRDPELIIFDEATTSLDKETEEQILNFIKSIKNSKTLIIISHDLNILDFCDYVYKIENKKFILKNV